VNRPAVRPLSEQADRVWEGMVRRNTGVVLLKSRWDVGTIRFKEATLSWTDAKDEGKNIVVPGKAVAEQFLTCLKKPGGEECFEWGIKTTGGETYRFRDVTWAKAESGRPGEIYEFVQAIYPSLIASKVPVDEK
jgi:hypothetical protein